MSENCRHGDEGDASTILIYFPIFPAGVSLLLAFRIARILIKSRLLPSHPDPRWRDSAQTEGHNFNGTKPFYYPFRFCSPPYLYPRLSFIPALARLECQRRSISVFALLILFNARTTKEIKYRLWEKIKYRDRLTGTSVPSFTLLELVCGLSNRKITDKQNGYIWACNNRRQRCKSQSSKRSRATASSLPHRPQHRRAIMGKREREPEANITRRWYRSLMYTCSSAMHERGKALPRNMLRCVYLPPSQDRRTPAKQL